MKIILLTHERELNKTTNTGRLVKEVLANDVEIIIWKRKEPNDRLCNLLQKKRAVLLFPDLKLESKLTSEFEYKTKQLDSYEFCVILDSTWQEARKMFNRSSYLQEADKISLKASKPSEFKLRRNQLVGGLSTVECVIEIMKQKNYFKNLKIYYKFFRTLTNIKHKVDE